MSNPTLDLLALDDAGIQKLYADRIRPILQASEVDRQSAMRAFMMRGALGGVGALAVAAVTLWGSGEIFNALAFGGVAAFVAYWIAYQPLGAVATSTKEKSLSTIAEAIGCSYRLTAFDPPALPKFGELRLLPSCDRSSYEDCFSGNHRGCAFSFYEGHLEKKVRTKDGESWQTVFRGQLMCIAFPKKFLGTTIVRRDAGIFNALQRWFTGLQRVDLGDSRLEKAFEVYSSDQVEARYLIHPVFMERLLALETHFKGKNLRGAFADGELLIAVEGGDKFEVGSMFAPLEDIGRARSIVADITEIMHVIEAVLTAERGVLPSS
jgi:hypothetical protein